MLGIPVDSAYSARAIVGREHELGCIEAALDAVAQGESRFIAVEGEAGIGKTRLLAEIAALAEGRGATVLRGSAAEFERDMPFSVWVDALDAFVASQRFEHHEAWTDALEEELGQVLPSLRQSDRAGAIADERYKAHRAVRTLLRVIADKRPLAMLLDDLHWSDPASVELIAALLARDLICPLMLVLSYRPGQAPERLVAAAAGPRVERIRLRELDEEQAAALLAGTPAETVSAIFRHGGGNPFYLEQLGRASHDQLTGRSSGDTGNGAHGVPPAVAAAIAEELGSLEPPTRLYLEGAAVAGDPFEPEVAAAAAELGSDGGLVALDDLLERDLVRSTEVPRRFAFRHPLVRGAFYDAPRGGWRSAAHGRAAQALQAQGAGPAERAHHLEQSAGPGDEEAIARLLEAGRLAAPRAPAAAVRWFEAALRLLPAAAADRRVDLHLELASALRSVGELERCRATLLAASELLPADDAERHVELTALCAAVEHWMGRHEEAHRRLDHAWADLSDRDSVEAAALQIELAVDGMFLGDRECTMAMGSEALATARTLGDRSLIAAAASILALGEASEGSVDAAHAHRREALEQIERMSETELSQRLETLYFLAWSETYLELFDVAIARAEQGVAIARATGEGRLLVPLMLCRGAAMEITGRLRDCVAMCESAVEISRLSANPHYLFWSLFELAWANYFAGEVDDAIAAGEESLKVGGRLLGGTMPGGGGGPGWVLAVSRFEAGDLKGAAELMEKLGDDGMESWIPIERFFNWEDLARVEIASGRIDNAAALAARSEAAAAELDLKFPTTMAARTTAAVLLARGDAAGAAAAAQRSLDAAVSMGGHLQAAFSLALLGEALAAAGERPRAIEALREAERQFETLGSIRMRDATRRQLRKLGARAEKRGPATAEQSGLEALTAREREIADLITDRLTNREIAERLFLSAKTIESHVRNLFMKLGVSSRVDVARAIERERREQAA
jgi:DNA-binding NarL/FixJ family response regulator